MWISEQLFVDIVEKCVEYLFFKGWFVNKIVDKKRTEMTIVPVLF